MRFIRVIAAAATLTALGSVSALAQAQSASGPKIYAYKSSHNFCPAGLQPVTMDGVICCGRPNQGISYQQALAHSVAKKRRVHRVRQSSCPVGTKGCSYD